MKKDVSSFLLIALIVFSIPLLLVVECVSIIDRWRPPEGSLAATAMHDAEADIGIAAKVDTCLWLSGGFCLGISGGCLLGSLGIVAAGFYEPSPPPMRLVGKSPEYIDAYVVRYKEERTKSAVSGACLGCIAGAITAGCLVTPWAAVLGTFAGRIAEQKGW